MQQPLWKTAWQFLKKLYIDVPCVSVSQKSLSRVRLFVTPWSVALPASPSMEFSRKEYWSGLPFHSPGDLPDSGTEPMFLASPALVGEFFTTPPPGKPT